MISVAVLVIFSANIGVFAAPVSTADVSASDIDPNRPLAKFTPSDDIPANVEIPDFYRKVNNALGLYIFMTSDGTVYKRVYGDVEGVFGWYEASGASNVVYADTEMIDLAKDREIYNKSPWNPDRPFELSQDYAGILPPEAGTTALPEIFGVPTIKFVYISAGTAALICIIILLSSLGKRRLY